MIHQRSDPRGKGLGWKLQNANELSLSKLLGCFNTKSKTRNSVVHKYILCGADIVTEMTVTCDIIEFIGVVCGFSLLF